MFPDLSRSVRLHKISDFYSLVVLIQSLDREGFILNDKARNRLAWEILVALSNGVDELSLRSKKLDFKTLSPREVLFRQYLETVREGSDSEGNRRKRHDLLWALMQALLERKDADRLFSPEQRRILWNTADERVCAECGCALSWRDFHADHIKPFSLGGKTSLDNAALLCVRHNLTKGNRSRKAA
jgi:5-methylcytosine-specific restriction endonuclease McrA